MLLYPSQSHAVSHEAFRWQADKVLIFPCLFGNALFALNDNATPIDIHSSLWSLHLRAINYSLKQIWRSTLLLIPMKVDCQHVLLVVSNAHLAISQVAPARSIHEVLPGHSRPDREPFAILCLNSAMLSRPREVKKLMFLVRKYLEVLWR